MLRLRKHSSLLVYDVASHEFAGEIPADDDPLCFASGREKLVLGLWGQSAIQRWDLTTLELEAERLVVGHEAPRGLAMGADSDGPILLVTHGGNSKLIDLQTLQTKEVEADHRVRSWKHYPSSQHRVSANRRVFCAWDYQTLIAGVNVLNVQGGQVTYATFDDSVGHICPNGDGSHLFTAIGRYLADERPNHLGQPPGFVIPAISGSCFLRVQAGRKPGSARFTLFTAAQPEHWRRSRDSSSLRSVTFKSAAPLTPNCRSRSHQIDD